MKSSNAPSPGSSQYGLGASGVLPARHCDGCQWKVSTAGDGAPHRLVRRSSGRPRPPHGPTRTDAAKFVPSYAGAISISSATSGGATSRRFGVALGALSKWVLFVLHCFFGARTYMHVKCHHVTMDCIFSAMVSTVGDRGAGAGRSARGEFSCHISLSRPLGACPWGRHDPPAEGRNRRNIVPRNGAWGRKEMGVSSKAVHARRRPRGKGWSRTTKASAAVIGAGLAGAAAYGATLWVVGLNSGSSGQAKSYSVSNLTVTAVATPTPTNLYYPDGSGDVVVKITNPNHFPVTITKVKLPKSTVYATGYTTSSLTSAKSGCSAVATGSDVSWHYSSSTTGSVHTLHTALTVAATGQSGDPLTVTFTNDGFMGTTASATCENIFFKMPALIGVTAYGGGSGSSASSPTTDRWTS